MAQLTYIGKRFRAGAEIEATTPIMVGAASRGTAGRVSDRGGSSGLAFAKLVELRRRQYGLSAEALADKAAIDLEEVVNIERGEGIVPEPRTVRQLAQVLQLPERKLQQLAGLVEAKDNRLREATVRFAARSEPVENLLPEEQEALEEFVKLLAE